MMIMWVLVGIAIAIWSLITFIAVILYTYLTFHLILKEQGGQDERSKDPERLYPCQDD